MSYCRLCYESVAPQSGLKVPYYAPDENAPRPLVHRDCLSQAVRSFAGEHPENRRLLRYLVEYEKSQLPKPWVMEATAGATANYWNWEDVGVPPHKIRQLVEAGIASVVFSSRSTTEYALVGRDIVDEVLSQLEVPSQTTLEELPPQQQIPEDLFSVIAGYDDLKEFLKRVIKAKRFHVLFVGPPASAKTVFLLELARLPGAFYCLGSATTKAGLADVLFEQRPDVLLADEIDKFQTKDLAVLLSLAETGIIRETKVGKQREARLDTNIFAAANSTRGMPKELLSRFRVLHLSEYTKDEFIQAAKKVLTEREKVAPELAAYIAEKTWGISRDIREAVRTAKICRTVEDVDRDVEFMRKYAKRTSNN